MGVKDIKIGNLFKGDKVVWIILFLLCMVSIVADTGDRS